MVWYLWEWNMLASFRRKNWPSFWESASYANWCTLFNQLLIQKRWLWSEIWTLNSFVYFGKWWSDDSVGKMYNSSVSGAWLYHVRLQLVDILRNPSGPFLLNHFLVAVGSAIKLVCSSFLSVCFSVGVLGCVRLCASVLSTTLVL